MVVMAIDAPEQSRQMISLPEVNAQGMLAGAGNADTSRGGGGEQLFAQYCAGCHGTHGEGGAGGPSLVSESGPKDLAAIVAFVKDPKPPMPDLHPSPLNDQAVSAVSQYVRTLQDRAKGS